MKLKNFFYLLPVLIFSIWLAYPYLLISPWAKSFFPQGDWARRGVIGDSFGALNTLFAGLALAGLVANLYLQSVQLKKLEKKEQGNEDQLATQVEALRLTALLNYYTSEIDRLERLSDRLAADKNSDIAKNFWQRFGILRTEREGILAQLMQLRAIQPRDNS
jgi:hypothetical protein